MQIELEPLSPLDAVEMYLEDRVSKGYADETVDSHYYRLIPFVDWCSEVGIENINNLTGRDLYEFRVWRRDGDGDYDPLKTVTLQGQLSTLRRFLSFCANIEAVSPGLYEKVELPSLERGEESSDEVLIPERAFEVLGFLDEYRYASRDHALMELVFHVGMRLGGVRTLDLKDVDFEFCKVDGARKLESAFLELRHRPESDTPLKNKYRGERDVVVDAYPAQVLYEYIQYNRVDAKDEFDRVPLFTTRNGRVSRGTVRQVFYRITRPCLYEGCPHGRDVEDCEAVDYDKASKCPSSRSPHPVRRGSITYQLESDVDPDVVSERVNSDRKTIEKYYDQRSKRQKALQRKRELKKL